MKLNKPNQEKLFLRRATLWASVYQSTMDAFIKEKDMTPTEIKYNCRTYADEALKEFDSRFNAEKPAEPTPQSNP